MNRSKKEPNLKGQLDSRMFVYVHQTTLKKPKFHPHKKLNSLVHDHTL